MKPTIQWLFAILLSLFLFSCTSSRNVKGFQYTPSSSAPVIGQNEISFTGSESCNVENNNIVLPEQKISSPPKRKHTDINAVNEELKTSSLYLQNGKLKILSKNSAEVPVNAKRINSIEELKQSVKNGEVKRMNERRFKRVERVTEKFMQKRGLNDSNDPLIWAAIFLGAALVLTIVNIEIAALVALVIGLYFLVKWIINESQ